MIAAGSEYEREQEEAARVTAYARDKEMRAKADAVAAELAAAAEAEKKVAEPEAVESDATVDEVKPTEEVTNG